MMIEICGTARLLGNNIDTDQIFPGRYLALTDKSAIAKHCLEDVRQEFSEKHAKGSIIVAGKNFGCGSSREHAVITLQEAGVLLVIASSFARIFFRNAVNLGFPVLICKDALDIASEGDRLKVGLSAGTLENIDKNIFGSCEKLPEYIMDILKSGGVKPRFRKIYGDEK